MAASDGPVPVGMVVDARVSTPKPCSCPATASPPDIPRSRSTSGSARSCSGGQPPRCARMRRASAGTSTRAVMRTRSTSTPAGAASFAEPHVIECEHAPALRAAQEHHLHWRRVAPTRLAGLDLGLHPQRRLDPLSAPPSMLVIGAGATGVELVSIFDAFGSQVTLSEAAPRILMSEDEDDCRGVNQGSQRPGSRSSNTPGPSNASTRSAASG